MKTRLGEKELFSLVLFFIWVTATCQGLYHIDLTPAVGVRHWEHRQISIWFHASLKEGSFFAPKNKAVDSFLDWRVGQGQDWRQREEFFFGRGTSMWRPLSKERAWRGTWGTGRRLLWLEGDEGEEGAQGRLEAWQAWEMWGLALVLSRDEESGFDSKGSAKLWTHFKEEGEMTRLGSVKPPF